MERDLDICPAALPASAPLAIRGSRTKLEARVEVTGPLRLVATPAAHAGPREDSKCSFASTSLPPFRGRIDHGRGPSVGHGTGTRAVVTGTNGAVMEG